MEGENSESALAESNSSFLNKAFVKGFLAGIVFELGILISNKIWDLLEPYERFESVASHQVLPVSIIYFAMPLLIIYLVGNVVKFALGRFGFEGWTKGNGNFVHLFSAFLGFFVGIVVLAMILSVLELVWIYFVTGV